MIASGNTFAMTMVHALIEAALGRIDSLLAERGYASNAIRAAIADQGARAVIQPTCNHKTDIACDRQAHRARNLVERLWCRWKDWRGIATRYGKLAANYMAGVFLAAAITFWCDGVLTLNHSHSIVPGGFDV